MSYAVQRARADDFVAQRLPAAMTPLEFSLVNDFQRGFPLVPQPFRLIGERLRVTESVVMTMLRDLRSLGVVARIGAVFAPCRIGAGALAALAVPPDRLEEVAARVSARREVNHNYEREHRFNLWFVATAACRDQLAQVLDEIANEAECPLIRLPLLEEFHIDLGFDLANGAKTPSAGRVVEGEIMCNLPLRERELMAALQDGLAITPWPYAWLAARAGLTEATALELIEQWLADGFIKRFGVVVRHHELGYRANAMCVWDVPDSRVSQLGARLAAERPVTLCYRRARAGEGWPYNLFCMIHGTSRAEVTREIQAIQSRLELDAFPHTVLFSRRRFKQRGARYF